MRLSTLPLGIATVCAALTCAQTPADSWPSTSRNIGSAFQNITVTPGKWISPSDVTSQPTIYLTTPLNPNPNPNASYMLLMLDLSIPSSDVTTASLYSTLTPGLAPNTTTRLHWWQGNYTLAPSSSSSSLNPLFLNSTNSIAAYTAPRPRDSTNHTYAFYMFAQPANYFVGEEAANGTYYEETTEARFNFSLKAVVESVGEPVAANWFVSSA
ncbi:hypothetical protein BCIN_11g02150 [Botrytis cinerea B05.10]|uniref:PEBP-like protein n=1 Tax=Botryotinia fuckeliana (strain B05.10) TaxID=332648 RepID=A0A384JWB3_BOTFB|nr:hypothetical protein BCIN_11g02150 [Botrytis cinerea B05.10]ATZ54896.1 hypothetical protein BCIN_11g02150 [Botrytis cinerea B05.10]